MTILWEEFNRVGIPMQKGWRDEEEPANERPFAPVFFRVSIDYSHMYIIQSTKVHGLKGLIL